MYISDGSSQLREMTRDKNNTAQIEGVMIALQTNGADQENLNHVFLSFSDPREEYISYCRDLLHTLFLSEVVCCVCFDAQELLISLIGYLSIPCHSVYAGWSVMDLKVSQLKYIKLFSFHNRDRDCGCGLEELNLGSNLFALLVKICSIMLCKYV